MKIHCAIFAMGCLLLGCSSNSRVESKQQIIATHDVAVKTDERNLNTKPIFYVSLSDNEILIKKSESKQVYSLKQFREWLRENHTQETIIFYFGKQFIANRDLAAKVVPELEKVMGEFKRSGKYLLQGNGLDAVLLE